MTYQLRDQLREAGLDWDSDNHDFPTLSELIEAFGKDQERLELFIATDGHTKATSTSRSVDEGFVEGPTPEEAVTRLWLALHKPTN